MDFKIRAKNLFLSIKEQEDKYVSGECDVKETLNKTDELFESACSEIDGPPASKLAQDSFLMELQTNIVRLGVKKFKIDQEFDTRKFSEKLRNYYCPRSIAGNDQGSTRSEPLFRLWEKLGEKSKETMYTVPSFNYIYGTFDIDPIEQVKKQRKRTEKDKIGDVTKPIDVDASNSNLANDTTLNEAQRIFSIFLALVRKSKDATLCFYEFVTDPASFSRTVENIFYLSLLVRQGYIRVFADEQGLPFLQTVTLAEKEERKGAPSSQTVLSISMNEFEDVVKTFNITDAAIVPRRGTK